MPLATVPPCPQVTVAVTGHHLILSLTEGEEGGRAREVWLLHRYMREILELGPRTRDTRVRP